MARCIDCAHGALRDQSDQKRDQMLRGMSKLGMVNCSLSSMRACFTAATREHDCKTFAPAKPDVVAKRVEFFRAQ